MHIKYLGVSSRIRLEEQTPGRQLMILNMAPDHCLAVTRAGSLVRALSMATRMPPATTCKPKDLRVQFYELRTIFDVLTPISMKLVTRLGLRWPVSLHRISRKLRGCQWTRIREPQGIDQPFDRSPCVYQCRVTAKKHRHWAVIVASNSMTQEAG